ncbi:MAG: DinB family protein [Acidobacteriota bacterium]
MQTIVAQLDAVHQQLLDTVRPISVEQFAHRPSQTEWSIAEVIHHLYLVEKLAVESLEKALKRPPEELSLLRRMLLPPPAVIGWRGIRVRAPKVVEPLDAPSKQQTLENYNGVRDALKKITNHGRERLEKMVLKHLVLGLHNGVYAVQLAHYHEVRHFKQIQEIIKNLGKN